MTPVTPVTPVTSMATKPDSPTWLVTGASGFLGFNCGQQPHGNRLVAVTRSNHPPTGYDSHVAANLLNADQLLRAVETVRPNYILHTAALASHEECEQDPELAHTINAVATETLALAAGRVGAKFIYISTDAVFNGFTGGYTESDSPDPFSVYGATKLQGEVAALAVNPESLIVRTNFFGWSPTGDRSILEFFVTHLKEKTTISGYTDFTVTSMYVSELVRIIHQLSDRSGVWHVAAPDSLSKYEFGQHVAQVFEFDPHLIEPVSGQGETSRSRDISLNTDKLQKYLESVGVPQVLTQRAGIERARQDQYSRTDSV